MDLKSALNGFLKSGVKTINSDGKVYTFSPGAGGSLTAPVAKEEVKPIEQKEKAKSLGPVQTAASRG